MIEVDRDDRACFRLPLRTSAIYVCGASKNIFFIIYHYQGPRDNMSTDEDKGTGSADSGDFLDPDLCDYEKFFDCDDGSLDPGDDF